MTCKTIARTNKNLVTKVCASCKQQKLQQQYCTLVKRVKSSLPYRPKEKPEGKTSWRYRRKVKVKYALEQATKALDGLGDQRHAPAALCKETQYPTFRRLGGTQVQSGPVRKISPQPGFDPDRPARYESLYRLSYPGPKI